MMWTSRPSTDVRSAISFGPLPEMSPDTKTVCGRAARMR
jgi:hypothetical protein